MMTAEVGVPAPQLTPQLNAGATAYVPPTSAPPAQLAATMYVPPTSTNLYATANVSVLLPTAQAEIYAPKNPH